MPAKYLQFLAVASIAIFGCSLSLPTANALAAGEAHGLRRSVAHGHVVKGAHKKRTNSNKKRCLPRGAAQNAAPGSTTTTTTTQNTGVTTVGTTGDTTGGTTTPPNVTPGGTYANGRKVGLTWTGNCDMIDQFITDRTGWYYNWNPTPNCADGRLEYVPMLWGTGGDKTYAFQQMLNSGLQFSHALSFNEPNEPGQANVGPEYAAQVYKDTMQPLREKGIRVGCPATSSNPNGLVWMKAFFAAGADCDFMPLHYYDVTSKGFIDYVNLWHDTFGKNIWITEFACQNFNGGAQCTTGEIWDFFGQVTRYFQEQGWVERYAAFGTMPGLDNVNPDNALMTLANGWENNPPTALGNAYVHASI